MFRPHRIPLLALVLLALGSTLQSAPAGPFQEPADVEVQPTELSWVDLIRRDGRVSFTRRSGHDAGADLESRSISSQERALRLMAIGCTEPQLVRQRPLLERYANSGATGERLAAILALGEFGEGAEAALEDQLAGDDAQVRGCAMLGLLRTGRKSARQTIERIAASSEPDSRLASELLVFIADPLGSARSAPAQLLMELRWESGRKFGLIDGESWPTRALARLIENPRFLNSVILGASSQSSVLGIKDHLLACLVDSRGEDELRAATVAMPEELAALIESGLWKPQGNRGWRIMLEEIDAQHLENQSLAILSLAIDVPEVEVYALMLLARGGLPEPLVGLEEEWGSLNARDRRLACAAWALAEDPDALGFMKEFEGDADPGVRASLVVAQARLGDIESHTEMKATLSDAEHEDYAVTLSAALNQAQAPLIRTYLEELLESVEGEDRLRVARALSEAGVAKARLALAESLKDGFPGGQEGVQCVRALVGRDASAHIDLFRAHFPVEDDLLLNIELARAIISSQDDFALRFVRPALWSMPFDRSILAGQVIVSMQGLYGLRDELNRVPVGASTSDIRRVGFALGQWGGIKEVEFLRVDRGLLPRSPVLQGAILGAIGRRTH